MLRRLYEVLGITEQQHKHLGTAYRNLSRTAHPDKGGDKERFLEIQQAYEILSTDYKRKIVAAGGSKQAALNAKRPPPPPKAPAIKRKIDVTLAELYTGTTKKIRLEYCTDCIGGGPKVGSVCAACNGTTKLIKGGSVTSCDKCTGSGVTEAEPCARCKDSKKGDKGKTSEVRIEPGVAHGAELLFEGAGIEKPNHTTGDLTVVVSRLPDRKYHTQDSDLIYKKKDVTLREALLTRTCEVELPTGVKLAVELPEDLKKGTVVKVPEHGLPSASSRSACGDLYVTIGDILLPHRSWLTPERRKALESLLPP